MEGRRKHVRRACTECALAHSACSDVRPCTRCVTRGLRCKDPKNKKRIRIVDESSHFAAKRRRMQPWESAVDLGCMVTSFHPADLEGKTPMGLSGTPPIARAHVLSQHPPHQHQHQHPQHQMPLPSHGPYLQQQPPPQQPQMPHMAQHPQQSPPHISQHVPHTSQHVSQHTSVQRTYPSHTHPSPMAALAEPIPTRSAPGEVSKYYSNLYGNGSSCGGSQSCQCPCTGGSGPCAPGCECTSSRAAEENGTQAGSLRTSGSYYYSPNSSFKSSGPRYSSEYPGDRGTRSPSLQHLSCCCLPPLSPLRPLFAGPGASPQASSPVLATPSYGYPPSHSAPMLKEAGVLPPIAGLMESLSRSPSPNGYEEDYPPPDRKQDDSERDVKPNINFNSSPSDNRSDSLSLSHDSNYQLYQKPPQRNQPNASGQRNPEGVLPSIMEPKLFRPHHRGVV